MYIGLIVEDKGVVKPKRTSLSGYVINRAVDIKRKQDKKGHFLRVFCRHYVDGKNK